MNKRGEEEEEEHDYVMLLSLRQKKIEIRFTCSRTREQNDRFYTKNVDSKVFQ